jgi:hypothetical protein
VEEEPNWQSPRECNNEETIYDLNLLDSILRILISAVQEDVGER